MPSKGDLNGCSIRYEIRIRDLDLANYMCAQCVGMISVCELGIAWETELMQVLMCLPGSVGRGMSTGDSDLVWN